MKSEYIVERSSPVTKTAGQEVVDIFAEAVARAGTVRKLVGAEVVGMTACPCAQEIMRDLVRRELSTLGLGPGRPASFTPWLTVRTQMLAIGVFEPTW